MTKRVYVTRKIPEIGISILKEKGYEVDMGESQAPLTQAELKDVLSQKPYDAVLSLLTDKVDASIFDVVPTAKIFANYASGFDNIDLIEAKKRGIMVTNAPAPATSEVVAQHTIAMIVSLASRIVEADAFVRAGKYAGWDPMNFIGADILGKTLGLVGAGRIGERVAHYAHALGFTIIYTDVVPNERIEQVYGAKKCDSLETLLAASDVVSLHVPLLPSTHHLMSAKNIALMKETSFLINTSRGGAIDEAALEQALREKKIRGAGLDVFEFEPKISAGLTQLPNVILTPHIASASETARNEMAEIAAHNIVDFFEGKTPRNAVPLS